MSALESIIETFQWVDPPMRLELLLDYTKRLPPLPEPFHALRDRGLYMVHECQSPVFLKVEVKEGRVHLYTDVPEEAPTARSFVAIMVEAFEGVPPQEVLAAPSDILHALGLADLIGMQRTRGLTAIYRRIKNEVARALEEA